MEILGIGLPELAFIVLIALILLGPKDMVAAGRTFGKTLRKIITSPTWKAVRTTGQELQQLPTRLMREAGLDEELKSIEQEVREATQFNIDPRQVAPDSNQGQSAAIADAPPAQQEPGPDPLPEDPQA